VAMAGCGQIEIDLRNTTFMDSTGLSVLVTAYHQLGQAHEAIVLRDPPESIRKLLNITGLEVLMDIRADGDRIDSH
jgi:anti-sigma B factor antagonist